MFPKCLIRTILFRLINTFQNISCAFDYPVLLILISYDSKTSVKSFVTLPYQHSLPYYFIISHGLLLHMCYMTCTHL